MTPEQYVQDKAQKSGSSFYYAFMFLSPARRQAMTAFYAFCREVDDVADEVQDPGVAATKLDWWRREVDASTLEAGFLFESFNAIEPPQVVDIASRRMRVGSEAA